MIKQLTALLAGVFLLSSLTACSVGMAMSGKREPNLGALRVGSTRGEAELQLGSPVSSVTTPDGGRTDIYEYELGNEPSAGRAAGHAVLDVLTLGIWEVAGTPIEASQADKHRITIIYGPDDRILAINQAPVPAPPKDAEEDVEEESVASAQATPEIPKVEPKDKRDQNIRGTCFAVRGNGILLTTYHVVQGAKSIQVHLADGTVTNAKVQTYNAGNDLAVLQIGPRTPQFLPLVSTGSARLGERVFTVSYPGTDHLGEEARSLEGVISALSGPKGEASVLQISVPIQADYSGGPIVNELGEVVGIIDSAAALQGFRSIPKGAPPDVSWAINADYARLLFDAPTVQSVAVGREEAIKRLRQAVCMVEASSG
ncbi:MAG: serine protease [Candidatus Methylomirabilales bacterium]